MKNIITAVALALSLSAAAALAQAPLDGSSLTWMAGNRVHTNANGGKIYLAFVGPVNGIVAGTVITAPSPGQTYIEYDKLGPNADGKYGLTVASTSTGMASTFTPLKSIEKGRVVFESADRTSRTSYFAKPGNGVGAIIERKANETTTITEYDFKPL
jgi:hypothetical protein